MISGTRTTKSANTGKNAYFFYVPGWQSTDYTI